jgi:ABC-2 type transport system permease protein
MLAEERERRVLRAVLVTQAKVSELLLSRAALGLIMTTTLAYLTLTLNMALPPRPSLLVTTVVSALISTEVGILCGILARDTRTVPAFVMTMQILTGNTLVLCLAVTESPWIANLLPTYWILGPLYAVAINGATFADLWPDLAVAGALAVLMAVAIVVLGRRMEAKLAST